MSFTGVHRLFGRVTRAIAVSVALVLVVNFFVTLPARAAPPKANAPEAAQRYDDVPGGTVAVTSPKGGTASAAARLRTTSEVRWPAAATAEVNLESARVSVLGRFGTGAAETSVAVPGTPLRAVADGKGPARIRVETLAQDQVRRSGLQGVMFRVARTDSAGAAAPLRLEAGYGGFESAYGADWAGRLRALVLPECYLTRPDDAACRPVPARSENNTRTKTVTAAVALPAATAGGGVLVALAAGPSGGAGDFGATTLAPSSTWSVGGSSGGFSWQYPMRVPPAVGGPGPTVGLVYSSQSVDGRHAASNNQPGWIGEGFSYETGFIERRYVGCTDDKGNGANNTADTGDMCWATDNAVMSLNGSGGELLRGADGLWHPVQDDGSRIEKLTGGPNGDDNGEYWKVTAADGTKYWFGRNRLPGWSSGKAETNSTLTVPVAGNHVNEPCRQSTFAASFCTQAYRWNLDYIEDVHGNTASLWYARDVNYYGKNMKEKEPTAYYRDGFPVRIDYGTDNRGGTDTVYTATAAPAQVHFTTADRCVTASCGTKDKANWPDTPWDQNCASSGTCWQSSPSFWSSRRLTTVTTKVWKGAGYQDVDQWSLRQSFPDPGDGTRAGLWLEGITHRGLNGATVTLPEVTFEGIQLPNRVDAVWSDWAPAMNWWRVSSIHTEAGAEIAIDYSDADCNRTNRMPVESALDSNALRCYPVRWVPQGYTQPRTDYFHKYVVDSVQQIDLTAGGGATKMFYEYQNPENLPLWHWDGEDGLVQAKYKSWGQWRGYPYVVTKVGEGPKQQVMRALYFRGMHGDKTNGGTRTVNVTGLEGGSVPDYEHYAGMVREQIGYIDGVINVGTVSTPWRSAAGASRTINGVTTESRYVGSEKTASRALISGGQWRRFEKATEFDERGVPLKVKDLGNPADPADDSCTLNEYLPNTDPNVWVLHSSKRVRTWAGDCSASGPSSADEVLSDMRYTYDNLAYGTTPTKGLVTKIERMSAWNGGNVQFQTVGTYKHDTHGRTTESTDIAGRVSKSAYTPAAGGPLTGITSTNPKLWNTTVTIDPAHGEVLSESDVNSRVTSAAYDALGRRTKVWYADRPQGSNLATPSVEYRYTISKTSVNVVETLAQDANGNYQSKFDLYDGLLRPRQTQTKAVGGGRIVSATNFYDSFGRVWKTNDAYDTSGNPGTTLHQPDDLDVPTQIRIAFDSAGRPTEKALYSQDVRQWGTVVQYYGDYTTVTPPAGGTAGATYTDSRGRTTKLRQFHGGTPTGTYDEITYGYNQTGQLDKITDASGNVWSYQYDNLGRTTKTVDPDRGATEFTYNAWDQLVTSKDAEGRILAHVYNDDLGRLTSTRDGSDTGPLRVQMVYDAPAKGLTKSVSRWIGSNEYRTELITADVLYRPTQTRVTIPMVEGGLSGSYSMRNTYKVNGDVNTVTFPAVGDLAGETLTYEYDQQYGLPKALTTNYGDVSHYVIDAGYTELAEPSMTIRSTALTGAPFVQSKSEYDDVTHRLKRQAVIKSTGSAYVSDTSFLYDQAGNLKKIDDNPLNGQRDTQCFEYDHVRRLKQAWTPQSGDCSTAPASTTMGGPAPYWQEWDFGSPTDAKGRTGSRLREIDHLTPTGLQTTEYAYPNQGLAGTQPHLLTGTTLKNSAGQVLKTSTYSYDKTGNTTSRPGPNGQQTLTWDAEDHLTSVSDQAGTTSYVYDAGGNRLLAKDATGATLYLGGMEVRLTGSSKKTTRYYSFNGETVAQRTSGGVTWLCGDQQGTGNVTVSGDSAQSVTRRRQTPYGEARGTAVTWPNNKGFVGGDTDPTGLVHLGAREYDPNTGRFISVDPIVDFGDPQQMHGYSYSNNNPTTWSDPSGLKSDGGFLGGLLQGLKNSVNLWKMLVGLWKMLKDPKGAWNGLKGEAKKWEKKTGSFVMGWGCAISGICDLIDSCAVSGDPYECGVGIGEILGEVLISVLTGGGGAAAAAIKRAAAQAAKLAEKFGIKSPGIDTGKSDDSNGDSSSDTGDASSGDTSSGDTSSGDTSSGAGDGKPGDNGADDDSSGSDGDCDGSGHSFDPDTGVRMADGSTKRIEDVRVGDKVLATDPVTGETTEREVTRTWVNLDVDLTDLVLASDDGVDVIETTQHHPFRSETRNQWVDSGSLTPGERVVSLDGSVVTVLEVRNRVGAKVMHDLTVDVIHTYYVLTGDQPVLVHNCGGSVSDHSSRCTCASGGPVIKKRGPKPGMLGPHNQTIYNTGQRVIARGDTILAGGKIPGLPEARIPTPGGLRTHRRPDILAQRPDGSTYGINVGRQEPSGVPVDREVLAINDLEEFGGLEMHFVPYN